MYEVVVIENNVKSLNGHQIATWTEVFDTIPEYKGYMMEIISQENAFNSRFPEPVCFYSMFAFDTGNEIPVRIPIEEIQP